MKLIVGLGNPETKYNFTRHNFGFLALDFFAKVHNLTWQNSPKFTAKLIKSDNFILLKPETYYNLTGASVSAIMNYYKIPSSGLFVICDDLNLPFSTIRYREKGSDGGNNGLKSIESHLHTTDFKRLRLGTKNVQLQQFIPKKDFVLGKFTPEEKSELTNILPLVNQKITDFIHSDTK